MRVRIEAKIVKNAFKDSSYNEDEVMFGRYPNWRVFLAEGRLVKAMRRRYKNEYHRWKSEGDITMRKFYCHKANQTDEFMFRDALNWWNINPADLI